MASINMSQGTAAGKAPAALYQKTSRTLYKLIDLAKAATAKGSALASADVIQALAIPANTVVLTAGYRVIEVADVTGDLKFKLGRAASDAEFVGVTAGSMAALNALGSLVFSHNTSATNINLTFGSLTASVPTTGVLAVWANVIDLNEFAGSNINATDQVGVPQA